MTWQFPVMALRKRPKTMAILVNETTVLRRAGGFLACFCGFYIVGTLQTRVKYIAVMLNKEQV